MTLDGVDLSPLFISGATSHTGDTASPTSDALSLRNLYWHFPFYHPDFVDTRPQSAIRAGKYRLIYHYETRRVELFDLDKDPGATNDPSNRLPVPARKLEKELMTSEEPTAEPQALMRTSYALFCMHTTNIH